MSKYGYYRYPRLIDVILLWIFGVWNLLTALAYWVLIAAGEARLSTWIFAIISTIFAPVLIYFAIRYKRFLR